MMSLLRFLGVAIYRLNTRLAAARSRQHKETDVAAQEIADLPRLLHYIITKAEEKDSIIEEKDTVIKEKDALQKPHSPPGYGLLTSPMYTNKNTMLPTCSLTKTWLLGPVPQKNILLLGSVATRMRGTVFLFQIDSPDKNLFIVPNLQ